MSIASLIKRMRELGAPMEAIELAVAAVEEVEAKFVAAEEARKAGQRERTAKHRAASRDRNVTVTSQQRDPSPKDNNQTPTHEISPSDPEGSSAPQGAPKARKPRNRALPTDWCPGERSDRVRAELGRSPAWMNQTAVEMRVWAESKGECRTDWDATHEGWMRREAKREGERPPPRSGPPGGQASQHVALSRLADRMRIPDEPDRNASRFADHGPVIDHAGDGPEDRDLFEPSGGYAGQSPAPINLRVVGSRWG